nr:ABC transporter ATP-binding protein [Maridesulfovibrio hydrothermalis]
MASDPSIIADNKYFNYVYTFFKFNSHSEFIIYSGIFLIAYYVFRSMVNILYMYILNRYCENFSYNLAIHIFNNYLRLNYKKFNQGKTSSIAKMLVTEMTNMSAVLRAMLMLMSEMFVALLLFSLILYTNYQITLVITLGLGTMVALFLKTVSKKMTAAGTIRCNSQDTYYNIISETFNNLKIIRIFSSEKSMLDQFKKSGREVVGANVYSAVLSHVPRLSLETIGFSTIISIILFITYKYDNPSAVIPIVSIYAVSLYRLLPSLNRILSSYNNIRYQTESLRIVQRDFNLSKEKLGTAPIEFKNEIDLHDISFSYQGNTVLEKACLNIKKGEKVALIGPSGSGKSTIADILIGLYPDYSGTISIDGTKLDETNIPAWWQQIGYIPQNMLLFNSTVGDNISFGRPYDVGKIDAALKKADLYQTMQAQDGAETKVGENGAFLSGGQKQRLGIARAIYQEPQLLILDEATSALDTSTEERIMKQIYSLGKNITILVIAHRISTIEACDKIYRIENKKLVVVKDFNSLK